MLLINTIYEFIQWQTTRFAITDQRVAYQSGIFRRRGVSIPLNRINNVNFEQSFIARMLNNGVVTIESAGETGDSVFENIPDPEHVRALIFAEVEADEQADSDRDAAALAKAMRDQQAPPSAAPAAPSATERLAAPRRPQGAGPRRRRRVRHEASADPRRTLTAVTGQTRDVIDPAHRSTNPTNASTSSSVISIDRAMKPRRAM